jgi:hypothetical protein
MKIRIKIKEEIKIRKNWGGLKPYTRRQSNKKLYNRQKYKNKNFW